MTYNDTSLPFDPPGYSLYGAMASFATSCFILTFLADLCYWATASFVWETVSVWLLAVGLIVAGFAIAAGVVDFVRSRRIAGLNQPWVIILGHAVAFFLSLLNVFVHSRDGYTAVVPEGLLLSSAVVLVLLLTTIKARWIEPRKRSGVLS